MPVDETDLLPATTETPETVTTETPEAPQSVRDTVAASMKALADEGNAAYERDDRDDGEDEEPPKPGKLADRERDAHGRVLPKKPAEGGTEKPKPEKEVVPDNARLQQSADKTQPAPALQEKPVQVSPPVSWSIPAKGKWDALPPEVRDAIAKRESEISNGFKEYEGLKPFAERAKQSGSSLPQALAAYTGIEDLIRRDVGGGLMHIAGNAGLTNHEAAQLFAQLAQRMGYQFAPGNQNAPGGSPADQNADADPNVLRQLLGPVLMPLQQEIATLKTTLNQRAEADRSQRIRGASSVVETFRSKPEHRYYDNVEETIGDLLESGVVKRMGDPAADLAKAYDIACWQNPEIRELLINERAAKTQQTQQEKTAAAQRAAVSIRGAPQGAPVNSGGSRGNVRDDVAAAFAQIREQV